MFKHNTFLLCVIVFGLSLFQIAHTNDFAICTDPNVQLSSSVAFDGTNYLVVWEDQRNGWLDIYGARVNQAGDVLDPDGIPISTATDHQSYPAVAFDGTNYLVVWEDERNGYDYPDIYGTLVSQTGTVLYPDGIPISTAQEPQRGPSVAFDGSNYMVVWNDIRRISTWDIYGARVTPSGVVLDTEGICISATENNQINPDLVFGMTLYLFCWVEIIEIPNGYEICIKGATVTRDGRVETSFNISHYNAPATWYSQPKVAFDGLNFLVVWAGWLYSFPPDILGGIVTEYGNLLYGPFVICPKHNFSAGGNWRPDVAFDGITYLVAWEDGRNRTGAFQPYDIYGKRVSRDGVLVAPDVLICDDLADQILPTIAFGKKNYLIAWDDNRIGNYDIYGRLIDATLISKDATSPNQGRHLARAPNSEDLDWAYHTNIGTFWNWKGDLITGRPTYIERGKYPTIAENEPASPWVANKTGDSLFGLVKVSPTSEKWRKTFIDCGHDILPPSLVLSVYNSEPQFYGDLGYVVYTSLHPTADNCIRFSAFDSQSVWYEKILDYGNDISSPSIALTPGDYLHIVWRKENSIYYITTLEPVDAYIIRQGIPPVWSDIVPISEPEQTEPASNPFVEAYGEWVYVVWRGPNQEIPPNPDYGEIWQRRGRIRLGQLPEWPYDPQNMSHSPDRESDFPSMSTGYTTVWQESLPGNYEIYADILGVGDNINLSQTDNNSCYPHTNLLPNYDPNNPADWRLSTIWTEESISDTFYKVRYDDYYFSEPDTNI